MTNINTKKNSSIIEVRNEIAENGVEMEIVYVDNVRFCVLGYTSGKDKQAALNAIASAVNGSENIYESMRKLTAIANLHDANPNEEVEINGNVYYISYENRACYNENGVEIANCTDINCAMPDEAIKALLIERVK